MGNISEHSISDGIKVTIIGSIANILLVVIKLYIGFLSRSQALIADGIHSLSDLFSDLIVVFGLKWGRKEADSDHPFGHGRIETLSGMIVGFILLIVGVGMAVNAVNALYTGDYSQPSLPAVFAAGISILIKESMYWYTIVIAKKLKSRALYANAWHHRSDALSSIAVLIGVAATYLHPDWVMADILAALFVTYFVVKVGWSLIWQGLKEIVDTAPSKVIIQQIHDIARQIDGVHNVHDIRARFSASQILSEVHIVVNADLSVKEGHTIAKKVEAALLSGIEELVKVTIHVDPHER